MHDEPSLTGSIISSIAIIAVFVLIGIEYYECDGTLLRTLFWLECVGG